ncbi:MAG: type I-E CRISPR-associated protein Cse1/CasA, partial [Chloroflexi bacterium]|nr:type I-E CRISPR-associated protein Cse1/CasA [Chloroflexota bacterium]
MNLVADKWIPVVTPDGDPARVGMAELYERAHEIRDLACTPPQRIALMRLLICITQAALDGPEDEQSWSQDRDRIGAASQEYLKRWQEAF